MCLMRGVCLRLTWNVGPPLCSNVPVGWGLRGQVSRVAAYIWRRAVKARRWGGGAEPSITLRVPPL